MDEKALKREISRLKKLNVFYFERMIEALRIGNRAEYDGYRIAFEKVTKQIEDLREALSYDE